MTKQGSEELVVLRGDGAGNFTIAQTLKTGVRPVAGGAGLIDEDDYPDVVVVEGGAGGVSVFLGRGDGTLGDGSATATGPDPTSLALADLDRDGELDLAVANSAAFGGTASIAILAGRGDGSFAPPVLLESGASPSAIVAADLDRDGDTDLAAANELGNDITVFINDPTGTFARKNTYAVEAGPRGIAAADLDGDGFPELAVLNSTAGTYSVLRNRKDGTFENAVSSPGAGAGSSILPVDVDRDGDLDLTTGSLTISINRGDGTFRGPSNFPLLGNALSTFAGDLDGDGALDLVTATGAVLSIRFNLTEESASRDLDGNSVPDDCQGLPAFRRGEVNGDGRMNILDAIVVILKLFAGGPDLPCQDAADANDDGRLSVDDPIAILTRLFRGGEPLPSPGDARCGIDTTDDSLETCEARC